MELTLKTKVVIEKTKVLVEGIKVDYYGNSRISTGIIKQDSEGFFIEWNDPPDTRLDGSAETMGILEECGFHET